MLHRVTLVSIIGKIHNYSGQWHEHLWRVVSASVLVLYVKVSIPKNLQKIRRKKWHTYVLGQKTLFRLYLINLVVLASNPTSTEVALVRTVEV